MNLQRTGLSLLSILTISAICVATASGAPQVLTDQELTQVSGQGMISVSNASLNGLDFSTITLNANVTLNANLHNIVLGQYNNAANNGTGSDINIALLQFGTSSGSTAQQTVQITDPYFEFVYNNATGPGKSQVVGMRFGFEGIAGNVGLLMNSVSGSVQIDNGAAGVLTSNAYRASSACSGATCVALSQIGGVVAGNASGPSRDFWISMLSQPVQFPAQAGMSAPNMALAGIWLNWTDRLTAANISATVQQNLLAQLHH